MMKNSVRMLYHGCYSLIMLHTDSVIRVIDSLNILRACLYLLHCIFILHRSRSTRNLQGVHSGATWFPLYTTASVVAEQCSVSRMSSGEDFYGTEPHAAAFLGSRHNGVSSHEETIKLSMNANLPPTYDDRLSWLRYEDLVRDWITFTVVESVRQGPLRTQQNATRNA